RDVIEDGVDLLAHHLRRDVLHRAHAERVLRGDGSDDAGAEHAKRGKCLEIGLYSCSAAAVRAGDGQRNRVHEVCPPKVSSTAARSARAAWAMSSARKIAEMTATPDAPTATTARVRSTSIPRAPPPGRSARAAAIRSPRRAQPSSPTGGSGLSLDMVTKPPPMQA